MRISSHFSKMVAGVITLFKLQKSSVDQAYELGYNNALRDMRLHLDDEIRER